MGASNSEQVHLLPEILRLLTKFYPINQAGGRIITTPKGVMHQSSDTSTPTFYEGEAKITLTEDDLYEVYAFLSDNKQMANDLVMEAEVKIAEWQKLTWKQEPRDIKAEDKTILGKIGIAYKEKRRGNSLLALILISEDGSWTTITCWTENNPTEIEVAKGDMDCYIKELEAQKAFIG